MIRKKQSGMSSLHRQSGLVTSCHHCRKFMLRNLKLPNKNKIKKGIELIIQKITFCAQTKENSKEAKLDVCLNKTENSQEKD